MSAIREATTGRPAGQYNQRVSVQLNTPVVAADNQPVPSWNTDSNFPSGLWAKIESTGGGDIWKGRKISADTTHVVYIRSTPETRQITGLQRFIWNGVELNILGDPTDVDGRRFELVCNCKSRA